MVTTVASEETRYSFDNTLINWTPLPGIENVEFSLCGVAEERQIFDLIFKFDADKPITLHTHLANQYVYHPG